MVFRIIGISMGLGVTLFALVSAFLHLGQDPRPLDELGQTLVQGLILVLVAATGFAVVWWRARVQPLLDRPVPETDWHAHLGEIQTNVIIVWAVVEGGAFFAQVIYFMYGLAWAGIAGVVLMWAAVAWAWPKRGWVESSELR